MTPKTILVRAQNIEVHLDDCDAVCVVRGEERVQTTPHALTVLAAFAHPRAVADVLAGAAVGSQDWMELSSAVRDLASAGILIEPGATATSPRGFARPPIHVAMLDDHARTRGFINALRAVVRPEDIVLDIGTGTGVLATVAALAGAAHVNAIESSAIADAAERIFETNGVADRVTIVRGRSTRTSLPRLCNVLVTEIIGNDPLDEQLLDVVDDAKKRLLTPDARLIPSAIEVFAVAVDLPRRVYERYGFTQERIAVWREMYGVDFSALMSVMQTKSDPFMARASEVVMWQRVAPPVSLASIELTGPFELSFQKQVTFEVDRDVERLGILLAFRANLAPGVVLSTLPDEVDAESHWRYALWPSYDRPSISRGAAVVIDYGHGRGTTTLSIR